MKKRRNPFEIGTRSPSVSITPPDVFDSLRVEPVRKRNRKWERQHQNEKVVYRGVDPNLALKVKTIAGDLHVPEGEVARAVIEYALQSYQQGDLAMNPRPNPYHIRMTLFPANRSIQSQEEVMSSPRHKKPKPLWHVITTWRSFPPELKKDLSELASEDELNVPIGELITALLRFGLKAYDNGLFTLKPVQKYTGFPLALEDKK